MQYHRFTVENLGFQRICTRIHIYTHIYIYMCMYICTYVYTHMYFGNTISKVCSGKSVVRECWDIYMYIYICIYIYICTYIYIYICMYTICTYLHVSIYLSSIMYNTKSQVCSGESGVQECCERFE